MATHDDQSQQETNNNFGLPKAEFKPIETNKSNRWLKIIAIIVGIVLIIGVGVVYWVFQRSSPAAARLTSSKLKNHQEEPLPVDEPAEFKELHETSDDFTEHASSEKMDINTPLAEESAPEEHTQLSKAAAEPAPITRVSAPQGLYHVVVASYIDLDLAMDYAKQLVKQGANVKILEPRKGKYFFYVAVEQGASFQEANEKAAELKPSYGAQIWVLRY